MSMSNESEILKTWDINAPAWIDVVRRGAIPSRALGTDAAIIDHLVALGAGSALDVGCGEGWLARALTARGFTVTGVDGSRPLIEAARQRGSGEHHCIRYEELSADDTLLAGPFEYVICSFSLFSEVLQPLLVALGKRLAPRGHLVIQTLHPLSARGDAAYADAWRIEDFKSIGDGFRARMPWYYRTFASWLAELRAAGFVVTDCLEPLHPETGLPMSLLLSCQHESARG